MMEGEMPSQSYRRNTGRAVPAAGHEVAAAPQGGPAATAALVVMEKAAARMLSVSLRHLQRLRVMGGGPPYIQLGQRRIGYRPADLSEWLAGNRVASAPPDTGAQGAPR
jgi:hypothetical protein